MSKTTKIIIVGTLLLAIVITFTARANKKEQKSPIADPCKPAAIANSNLPMLLDLGARKCIPCKAMFKVLDELKSEYGQKLKIEFIDISEHPEEAQKYKVEIIPLQIFFDAGGKEIFRHKGYYPKEAIIAQWKELGVDLAGQTKK